MRISSQCECPNCGPYARLAPVRSRLRRFVAGLIHCLCFRCIDCGQQVLVRDEYSLGRRLTSGSTGLLLLGVVLWGVVYYPSPADSAQPVATPKQPRPGVEHAPADEVFITASVPATRR